MSLTALCGVVGVVCFAAGLFAGMLLFHALVWAADVVERQEDESGWSDV